MSQDRCFAIFGAGSIGCYLGGRLLSHGHQVIFIGRPPIQQELQEHGLTLTNWRGQRDCVESRNIRVEIEPDALKEADFVLVTVKGKDTLGAAGSIRQHVASDSVVVSFQNGIHNADTLRENLPGQNVLAGMVAFNVVHKAKGHFHCGTEGSLALEKSKGLENPMVTALEKSHLPVILHEHMHEVMWGKLVMNLNNSVNALAGVPLLEELNNSLYRKVLAMSIKEALAVLKAAGIKPYRTGKVIPSIVPFILSLPNWLFTRVAQAMLKVDPEARSSMWEDLQKGRRTEIDYLNGEIIKLAQKYDVSTPVNQKIFELVRKAEAQEQGPPQIPAETLLQQVSAFSK